MVGQLIKEEPKMEDVDSKKTKMGGGATTYIATFQSKNGTLSKKPMFTKE
jgi:hypothetical protein